MSSLSTELGEMNRPQVLESWRTEKNLHRLRLSAFARTVVHEDHSRLHGVHERFGVRTGLAVTRGHEQVDLSDPVRRTREIEFLVPGGIAKIEQPERPEPARAREQLASE